MNENDTRPLMVSIWCITYNHEPYIRQCLEGFVMQKTNFRFEAIVHENMRRNILISLNQFLRLRINIQKVMDHSNV